jgi:hypothetical protein
VIYKIIFWLLSFLEISLVICLLYNHINAYLINNKSFFSLSHSLHILPYIIWSFESLLLILVYRFRKRGNRSNFSNTLFPNLSSRYLITNIKLRLLRSKTNNRRLNGMPLSALTTSPALDLIPTNRDTVYPSDFLTGLGAGTAGRSQGSLVKILTCLTAGMILLAVILHSPPTHCSPDYQGNM